MRNTTYILLLSLLMISCNETDMSLSEFEGDTIFQPVEEEAYAFPGAAGFGYKTTGGRGGKVVKVTNLNDSGPGSLRNAINTPGARIVIFDVSGYIHLSSNLVITQGNITIAGQSAPGNGVTIRNHSLIVNADNVIIRYLRFRMGDEGGAEADAIEGRYKRNIIIDHCSMSWSTDETASFYANENFTMQWCILSESLRNSVHDKGRHGYGGIWGGKNASFHHNLLAHHDNRNPRFDHPAIYPDPQNTSDLRGTVDFRNNVIYNWGTEAAYGGELGTFNIVNNYFKPGPATQNSHMFLNAYKQASNNAPIYGYGKFYVSGNVLDGRQDISNDNWLGVMAKQGSIADKENMMLASPLPNGDLSFMHTAQEAYDRVLLYSGASLVRDAVDVRIVQETKDRSFYGPGSKGSLNGLIDSQTDVGGWPDLIATTALKDTDGDGMPDDWEAAHGLDPTKDDAKGRDLSSAYDNIEVYINGIVKEISDRQYK